MVIEPDWAVSGHPVCRCDPVVSSRLTGAWPA